ncbi:hypothetical protein KY338_00730 [Candidatus Woesearchaeota archaeon]|nr:hypothetical protein [Candidatus Woesearchaeota archaeon]MBW3006428.1 hypothetical protein [Candidatus Woesearchaeota archaeon]
MKFDLSQIHFSEKDLEKKLRLPKEPSLELAEIMGIHFGDGSMHKEYRYTYRLSYTSNISEKQYSEHINKLFKKVFNVYFRSKIDTNKNCVVLRFISKALCEFFNKVLKIPYGSKNNLVIPKDILYKKEYLIAFVRGLFDTDGCITLQRQGKYEYVLIKICTKHKNLAKELVEILESLGIPSFICTKFWRQNKGFDVVIRNKNAIKFFEVVGSSNYKNIKKWGRWEFPASA